jgi:hypothetical protein
MPLFIQEREWTPTQVFENWKPFIDGPYLIPSNHRKKNVKSYGDKSKELGSLRILIIYSISISCLDDEL